MRQNLKWIVLVFGIVLGLTLQACGPQGQAEYGINYVWKVDDNRFSVTEVKVVDSYTPDSGEPVTATDGNKLLVISCDVRLSDQWKVGSMGLHWEEKGFTAEWPKGPYEAAGRTDYIFSVPQNLISDETVQRFRLDVTLRDGEKTHTGKFILREI